MAPDHKIAHTWHFHMQCHSLLQSAQVLSSCWKVHLTLRKAAMLEYELFRISGKKLHRDKALSLYKKLYDKTANVHYRKALLELENATRFAIRDFIQAMKLAALRGIKHRH